MMPDKPPGITLRREISVPAAEYRRALGLAFPAGVEEDGGVLRAGDGTSRVELRLEEGPPRVIANIRLPTLFVELRFSGGTEADQQALLACMDRAMHRGGG